MKLKLAAILLAFIMLPMCIFAAAQDEGDYSKEMSLLLDLGILNAEHLKEEPVSRGDFTAAAVALTGAVVKGAENVFSDVSENADEINTAATLGIVKGMGDGTFCPENPVTQEQAVKILVSLLGYEVLADGIYPVGFMSAAAQVGLLKGVNTAAEFNWDMAVKLLYNAAHTDVFQSDLQGGYKSIEGENPITKWLHLNIVSGRILADEYAYITPPVTGEGVINISGKSLYDVKGKAAGKLGESVTAYCDEDNIVAVFDKGLSITQTIFSEDLMPQESGFTSLKYYDGDKQSYIPFESDIAFIYNGKNEIKSTSLLPKNGRVEITDTDSDGRAEIIKVYESETFLSNGINERTNTIIFADGKGSIEVNENCLILGYNGEMDISEIRTSDVLTITRSLDGEIVTIEVSGIKIKSEVVEIEGDKAITFANGETYKILDKNAVKNLEVGSKVNIYLDINERIAGISKPSVENLYYGYLIDTECTYRLGGYDAQMRIFNTATENIVNYKLTQNVTLNDSNKDKYGRTLNPQRAIDEFYSKGVIKNQLVKFQLNNEGEIYRLYKAYNNTEEPFEADDRFTLDYDYPTSNKGGVTYSFVVYNPSTNVINNELSISGAYCLEVPELAEGEKMIDKEEEISVVNPTAVWVNPNHTLSKIKIYDMDENKIGAVAVREKASGGGGHAADFMYIDKIATVLDEVSGEEIKQLSGYYKGAYVSYPVENSNEVNEDIHSLKKGDVIRILLKRGKIAGIIKMFTPTGSSNGFSLSGGKADYLTKPEAASEYTKPAQFYMWEKNAVVHAKPVKVSGSNIFADVSKSVTERLFPASGARVYVYDEERDMFFKGTLMDIDPASDKQSVMMAITYAKVSEVYIINRKSAVDIIGN